MVRRISGVAAGVLALATVTACSADEPEQDSGGRLTIVASTDVWGSVVAAVGGADVTITSIVSGSGADPHSYQVSAKDAAALRDADLVVSNGGGYDDYVDQALGSGAGPARIVAFEVHGNTDHAPSGAPATSALPAEHTHDNEHVWYDLHTVGEVADRIAHTLGELRPGSGTTFTANAAAFRTKLDGLETAVADLATAHAGAQVAATEPVAGLLLTEAGLVDVTPDEFVEAVEEENDPPAAAVADLQKVVTEQQVSVLVHNPQTETPVVTDLVEKARSAGVPVVDLTETLPDGQDYLTWMGNQIAALSQALAAAPAR
jgi:zinc/manganese transport system substrate-binding protein